MGKVCAYIDHENAFDSEYATNLGVDVENLIVTQPGNLEDCYDILMKLSDSGEVGAIMFDSIAAAVPQKELEGDVQDHTMGVKAKLNSVNMPKICKKIKDNNVMLLMVNQVRMKIGLVFGNPETEPGGQAVKYYPSIKVDLRQSTKHKNSDDEIISNVIKANCTKNKTAKPFMKAEFDIVYGEGINFEKEIVFYAEKLNIIQKSGSWYSYLDTKLGQGAQNVAEILKDNPELCEELEQKIKEHYGI